MSNKLNNTGRRSEVSKLLLLPGDGIGPEVIAEAAKIANQLTKMGLVNLELEYAEIGGAALDQVKSPLPQQTLALAQAADAVLLGAVGGPKWDKYPKGSRPEDGLLAIRKELQLFANIRPVLMFPWLVEASTLKAEVISGLDILIVRELTSGIYFGEPRGIMNNNRGERQAFNTMLYLESEIARIVEVACKLALTRDKRVCSVDKANVLEVSQLWREVAIATAAKFPQIELTHMYVDNAAMQLVRAPKQFDVIVTENLFGDILSDCAAMLTGSIGMLPSASLTLEQKGLYEPVHGSAPDLTGKQLANPIATILSLALMLEMTLAQPEVADLLRLAVSKVLQQGYRTADIATARSEVLSTAQMGSEICKELSRSVT